MLPWKICFPKNRMPNRCPVLEKQNSSLLSLLPVLCPCVILTSYFSYHFLARTIIPFLFLDSNCFFPAFVQSPPYNRCSRHKTRGCAYVIPRISILISDFLKICRSMFAYWTDKVIRKHFSFINISTNLTSPPRFFLRHWSIFDIGLIVGVRG